MSEILVELADLEQAERELSWLLARIQADEQEARSLYARLSDWNGQSANVTREYVEAFFYRFGHPGPGDRAAKSGADPVHAGHEANGSNEITGRGDVVFHWECGVFLFFESAPKGCGPS